MSSKLLSYALDFTSFFLQKVHHKDNIKQIILFGSVARDEDDEESDVDLFFDVVKEAAKIEKEYLALFASFLSSAKYLHYWKLLGIQNEIKLHIGHITAWKELHPSLISDGITLFGKYAPLLKEGRHAVFFIWENIQPNSKRVLFNKQLFGYKQGDTFYQGLLQKYNGERLGKGCISADLAYSSLFQVHFKKYKIPVKIKKVLLY